MGMNRWYGDSRETQGQTLRSAGIFLISRKIGRETRLNDRDRGAF
jgi:hypothetical protein